MVYKLKVLKIVDFDFSLKAEHENRTELAYKFLAHIKGKLTPLLFIHTNSSLT
jgi:hypothetical protein